MAIRRMAFRVCARTARNANKPLECVCEPLSRRRSPGLDSQFPPISR